MTRGSEPVTSSGLVRAGLCVGCGSCVGQSDTPTARMALNRYGLLRPAGAGADPAIDPGRLAVTCPFSPAASDEDALADRLFPGAEVRHTAAGRLRAAYVGAVAEDEYRACGSSGGLATWVLAELLRSGAIDAAAHVGPVDGPPRDGPLFRYHLSRTVDEIRAGAKSRYYPVEMSNVVRTIRSVPGRYAVVGVPCFVKAIRLLAMADAVVRERVVATLGLFCGHMKSARFVESFAWQMGVPIHDVRTVDFRRKDVTRPASTYTVEFTLRDGRTVSRDWWNLVDGDWGAGFFQDPACNACDDVVAEVADISFGDAWVEPYASDGRGTNVVIVRSGPMLELIERGIADGRLDLAPVDGDFVERTQAAGFRQRREGLGFRLTWPRAGIRPRKRVAPDASGLSPRRRLVYAMRAGTSFWSHRVYRVARLLRWRGLYTRWAVAVTTVYHALTYSRGRLGRWLDRIGLR